MDGVGPWEYEAQDRDAEIISQDGDANHLLNGMILQVYRGDQNPASLFDVYMEVKN